MNEAVSTRVKQESTKKREETDASTHFLRIQNNQLIDLMQHLERYTNTLPVFGVNNGRIVKTSLNHTSFPTVSTKKKLNLS